MKTDMQLKADLMEKLDAIPAVGASDIEVLVDGGMVVLSGEVDSPQLKFLVERIARRVSGMRGLELDISARHQNSKREHHPP